MARVTHVKKAQQRYVTVPVIDPATGEPVRTPVMKNGVQRTTKTGKPVTRTQVREDHDQPLPLLTCDACREPIQIGTPYKWVEVKRSYGGTRYNRHEACPDWNSWDLSNSLSARLAQIAHSGWEAFGDHIASEEDVTSLLEDVANEVRALSEEKAESASNIEDGFGHPTEASEELQQIADDLESWADEIEGADVPELPEPDEVDCDECGGTGTTDEGESCDECGGTGTVTPDEPTDEQMAEWRSEVEDLLSIIDEAPV
ncbi:MAG: hypothetical protein KGH75_00300 [Rhodospirillales bacterium]|nr:hypothetical protein [Rhodospirillales bacterium]